jgi:hypothetical protein
MMNKWRLKLGDLTDSPFVGKDLKIPILLVDEHEKPVTSIREQIKLLVRAEFEAANSSAIPVYGQQQAQQPSGHRTPCPDSFLEIYSSKCLVDGHTGSGSVTVRFNAVSMNFENKRVILTITPSNTHASSIQGVFTQPLYVCKHKLVISEENEEAYTWYKVCVHQIRWCALVFLTCRYLCLLDGGIGRRRKGQMH